jgi:hypothetical protein
MRFPLMEKWKDYPIVCDAQRGPAFGPGTDLVIRDNCNSGARSGFNKFGAGYSNNTGRDGNTLLAGQPKFQVREIEVFEIIG